MSTMAFTASTALMAAVLWALLQGGVWPLLPLGLTFGMIPLLDALLPIRREVPPAERSRALDPLLYGMVLAHFAALALFFFRLRAGELQGLELLGAMAAMGLSCGAVGINVAHELGHRRERHHQLAARLLLTSTLYAHFFVEHNRGHHARVSTPEDPASAPRGMSLYAFLPRSILGSLRSALAIEGRRVGSMWSLRSEVVQGLLAQGLLLAAVGLGLGPVALSAWLGASLLGILLLETVNYVEHYGLRRELVEGGRYEKVRPEHSWNSEHLASRALLFDLTRHSDHHAHPNRPYGSLRCFPEAPELPTGYSGMILLALLPPLFFRLMHPRLDRLPGHKVRAA